jgi:hypothetical protein
VSFANPNFGAFYGVGNWNNGFDGLSLHGVNGSPVTDLVGTIKVPLGQWYHLACVYKGRNASVYVNGTLSVSATNSLIDSATINITRVNNCFGYTDVPDIPNVLLDEIRLYKKALTQAQVLTDMNTASGIAAGIC